MDALLKADNKLEFGKIGYKRNLIYTCTCT